MINVCYRFLLEVNKENNKDRFKLKLSSIIHLRTSFFLSLCSVFVCKNSTQFSMEIRSRENFFNKKSFGVQFIPAFLLSLVEPGSSAILGSL